MFRGGSPASGIAAFTGGAISGVTGVDLEVGIAAVPIFSAPSGTMANNGVVTLGTALDAIYADCYLYLPAAAIVASGAGSAAGWYYAQMSSTTVGTLFNNVYTTGNPTVPASPTAFVTTGPGAFTGDTTEQGIVFTLPALPAGSKLYAKLIQKDNNSVGTKTARIRLNGAAGTTLASSAQTTGTDIYLEAELVQITAAKQRFITRTFSPGASVYGPPATSLQNLASATDVRLTVQKGTATDWVGIALGDAHYMAP